MFFRVLFTTFLLGSTILFQLRKSPSPLDKPLLILYGLIAGIFILSFCYALILSRIKRGLFFTYIQIGIDTFIVSMIIFVTGNFSSIFSFLYLLVIIYASILLFRKGSMIMAALCSIQYGIMIDLEYYGILIPFGLDNSLIAGSYDGGHILYKIIITMAACFSVAFLSSFLAEQEKKTRKELLAMEDHVKRVEKMAAIGEMGAGLAHEIKNPLASLTGSIQVLKEDIPFNPDHEKLMQIILREADRLSSLVNNFLLFAKPPVGKVEAIELSKALKETVGLFENDRTFSGRITITREFSSVMWVEIDPVHLRQVLWNLLLNAVEAIKDKGHIDISMYPLKKKHVGIKISDNGCGMSKEILKTIFDPFFTTKPNGTGLGLSIVHRILESYNSRLDVSSEIDVGTIFTLRLNRIDPPKTTSFKRR